MCRVLSLGNCDIKPLLCTAGARSRAHFRLIFHASPAPSARHLGRAPPLTLVKSTAFIPYTDFRQSSCPNPFLSGGVLLLGGARVATFIADPEPCFQPSSGRGSFRRILLAPWFLKPVIFSNLPSLVTSSISVATRLEVPAFLAQQTLVPSRIRVMNEINPVCPSTQPLMGAHSGRPVVTPDEKFAIHAQLWGDKARNRCSQGAACGDRHGHPTVATRGVEARGRAFRRRDAAN